MAKRVKPSLSVETDELRRSLAEFFKMEYDDPIAGKRRRIGSYKWGVYIFYDYDGEPIYVGQTRERVSARIGRHLTNQRTDAVAMSVLDAFEVYEIEVYPLPQFELVKAKDPDGSKNPEHAAAEAYLNALEYWVHQEAKRKSKFNAILNEKDPLEPTTSVNPPPPLRGCIVSPKVREFRGHSDVRIARRASIIARLAQTISEREVQNGLRRTLITQVKRLEHLASQRFGEFGGEASVPKGPENEEDK